MTVLDALLESARPRVEEAFQEEMHPRDFMGRFKAKLEGLKLGSTAHVPGGILVTRRAEGYEIKGGAGLGHHLHPPSGEMRTGRPAATERLSSPQSAAMLAVTRSLRSRRPDSFGGNSHYTSLDDYEHSNGKPGEPFAQWRRENLAKGISSSKLTRPEFDRVMAGQERFLEMKRKSAADSKRKREGGLVTTQHGPRPTYHRNADGEIAPPPRAPRAPGAGPEADRHGGFKIGDQVTHRSTSIVNGKVTGYGPPQAGEVVGHQRNGNLRIREPQFGTTVDVHHTKVRRRK